SGQRTQDIVTSDDSQPGQTCTLRDATDQFQQQLVQTTLKRFRGNQARSAKALGLDRGNFSRLLKRLHIDPVPYLTGEKP
ncbi:MAG: hypothetical protein KKD00_00025, partial [Gammaproteobacteria bacterium]|nr:hypothetical protein [Gammaproteobacteria bacterium]